MKWIFYVLFLVATGYVLAAFVMKRTTQRKARVERADLIALSQLKDAYVATAECRDAEGAHEVRGRPRSVQAVNIEELRMQIRALVGQDLSIYKVPFSNVSTTHPLFRGAPFDLLAYVVIATSAATAFLYSELGIHPIFDLIRFVTR